MSETNATGGSRVRGGSEIVVNSRVACDSEIELHHTEVPEFASRSGNPGRRKEFSLRPRGPVTVQGDSAGFPNPIDWFGRFVTMLLSVLSYRDSRGIDGEPVACLERSNMKSRVWLSVVAAVLGWLSVPSAARADEPASKAGPFVVIVGAGEFTDPAIKPRPTADADAKALYDLLSDPKYLDVKPDRVKLLTSTADEKRNGGVANHDEIVKAVEAATSSTGKDDLIILAFFGRGATSADKTVFLTPDTVFKDRAKTSLVFGTDLADAFKKVKGQKVLFMMDVAWKGYDPGMEKVAEPTLTDIDGLLFGPEDKEESVRPHNRLLLLSGFVSAEPIAKGDHGLFASTVIDALKGTADKEPYNEGYESDGVVTVDELLKYLDKEIPNQAREIGKTDKDKEAQAVPIGSRTSHFVITKNPAETAKVQKRLNALAALAKDGKINAEIAKEGANFLARMHKLKAHQELRKDYQKLVDGAISVEEFTAARNAVLEAMKLTAKDAESFARKVNEAAGIVTEVYIKQVESNEMIAAAIKGLYRRIEEPLPPDLESALKDVKDITEAKRMELLKDARTRLGKREDLDDNKDADTAIVMLMASLNDPYTVYYDKETVRRMASALRGRFPGVGIQIRRDAVHDALLVVSPIKGSPAFEGGIQAGDLIVKVIRSVDNVTGEPLPENSQKEYSTKGMKTEEAIAIITGKVGSPITLVVDRNGKEMKFDLKRNWVSVETVLGVKRDTNADWDYMLDDKNKIGYIRLTQFTQATAGEMRAAIEGLKKRGLNGLVLDLRGNPGGYLTAAVNICEQFVGKEKIVEVKPRVGSGAGRPRIYRGEKAGDKSFSLVVLINGHSASASEIVSACVQDHERAVVVGERTYGKGSVQDVLPFSDTNGEIKLTIARYYPPSGRNIDKLASEQDKSITEWGVTPDKGFEVKLTREEQTDLDTLMRDLEIIPTATGKKLQVDEAKDKQLKFAADYLRKQVANK
jgi:carboxyl-terminal processing protease